MKKPHKLTDKELSQLIVLQKKILKEARKQGIEMSKTKAKRLAVAHLGFVDAHDYEIMQRERGTQKTFVEGIRSAMPKYRNL